MERTDPLSAHGGARRLVPLCVICHNPGGAGVDTADPETGNSIDFRVMTHKIHMGSSLPSVQAGTPYQIIGFNGAANDWSTVVLPAVGPQNCQMCHEIGAPPQGGTWPPGAQTPNTPPPANGTYWLTHPNRAACGSCWETPPPAPPVTPANLPSPTHSSNTSPTLGESCDVCDGPTSAFSVEPGPEGSIGCGSFPSAGDRIYPVGRRCLRQADYSVTVQNGKERNRAMTDRKQTVRTRSQRIAVGLLQAVGTCPETPRVLILCGSGCTEYAQNEGCGPSIRIEARTCTHSSYRPKQAPAIAVFRPFEASRLQSAGIWAADSAS